MFGHLGADTQFNIGMRNVEMTRKILKQEKIRIAGEDTGFKYGRSVEIHIFTCEVLVKSMKYGVKKLWGRQL